MVVNELSSDVIYNDIVLKIIVFLMLLYGLCQCLFGYKTRKIIITVSGAIFGSIIGFVISAFIIAGYMGKSEFTLWYFIGIALGTISMAILAYKLYRFGAFISVLTTISLVSFILMTISTNIFDAINSYDFLDLSVIPVKEIIICVSIGLFCGIVSIFLTKPIFIITTSISGGVLIGYAFAFFINIFGLSTLIPMAICIIFGMVYQIKNNDGFIEYAEPKSIHKYNIDPEVKMNDLYAPSAQTIEAVSKPEQADAPPPPPPKNNIDITDIMNDFD